MQLLHRSIRLLAILPLFSLLFATGCKKNSPPEESKVYGLPADLALFTHLRPQELQKSLLAEEIVKSIAPAGTGSLHAENLDRKIETDYGIRPDKVDSLTYV